MKPRGKSAGNARNFQRGFAREREVENILESLGWFVIRMPGSIGSCDIVALRDGFIPYLIQVKAQKRSPYSAFPPADRLRLKTDALRAGATAVLLYWPFGGKAQWLEEANWPARNKRGEPDYIVDETGCWLWDKSRGADGYGSVNRSGRTWLAHRWYYEQAKGPVHEGLQLDHLCGVRACVNPDHLEPVAQTENIRRGQVTRLSLDEVKRIRDSKKSAQEMAEQYGVSKSWVYVIRRGNYANGSEVWPNTEVDLAA